jgi:hypothetical protein
MKQQVTKLQEGNLFVVNLDKDQLWELYLKSFPAGTMSEEDLKKMVEAL